METVDLLIEWRKQGREAFVTDPLLQSAILWRLQTLADSAGKLSSEVQRRHAEIPWRDLRGFRNIVVHAYLDRLDPDLVWRYLESDVESLGQLARDELRNS